MEDRSDSDVQIEIMTNFSKLWISFGLAHCSTVSDGKKIPIIIQGTG